jgi:hypothetical protein
MINLARSERLKAKGEHSLSLMAGPNLKTQAKDRDHLVFPGNALNIRSSLLEERK